MIPMPKQGIPWFGALLICSEETCVIDLAKVLLQFFNLRAAQCNPCRIGNIRALQP
jgi:NADP-reducing hydrogenase subunit HndC